MRKILFTVVLMLAAVSLNAGQHLRERVMLATDKAVYVAGDKLWCSAWCIDVNTGALSAFSDIAYVELHSVEGTVQTGKIALEGGRGAGTFTLSASLPTGNYSLIAYTAQSCNEVGFDYFAFSRTISIFNTLSTFRVKDGVEVVDASDYPRAAEPAACGEVSIQTAAGLEKSSRGDIVIANNSSRDVDLCLSVAHDDGIGAPSSLGIQDYVKTVSGLGPAEFISARTPEYEGEIIRTHLVGGQGDRDLAGESVFICVPEAKPNIYISQIGNDARAFFPTDNFYGDKDLFLGLERQQENCHLEVESPFVNPQAGDIPPLYMCRDFEAALSERSAAMQIGSYFDADTLYELLPVHQRLIMDRPKSYKLDDYTRFPVLEEVFIEFVTEVKIVRDKGEPRPMVMMNDAYRGSYNANMPALLMIDGVPVFDIAKFMQYDPLLVKQIDVYQKTYHVGGSIFGGAVNMITYKGNLPSFQFGEEIRIVNFQGASYPLAYTCQGVSGDYPDYRQTICWHPFVKLKAGESISFSCKTPCYGGNFRVTVEGIGGNLEPIYQSTSFTVE